MDGIGIKRSSFYDDTYPAKFQAVGEEPSRIPIWNDLPLELMQFIFRWLEDQDLAKASCVCSRWKEVMDASAEQKARRLGFVAKRLGREAWAHLGDVGEEPPLPKSVFAIMLETCLPELGLTDFEAVVGNVCFFALIPATLDGESLTLGRFKKILDRKGVVKITYWYPRNSETLQIDSSYWVFMSKACIKGSKSKTYDQQKQMVERLGSRYREPKVLEMTFGLYLQEAVHKDSLYGCHSWTRCQSTLSDGCPMACRGFGTGGGVSIDNGKANQDLGIGVVYQLG